MYDYGYVTYVYVYLSQAVILLTFSIKFSFHFHLAHDIPIRGLTFSVSLYFNMYPVLLKIDYKNFTGVLTFKNL